MKVEHPGSLPLSQQELQNLEILKGAIERAVADGVLTEAEMDRIKAQVWADHKVPPEKLDLVQEMIWRKVQTGELSLDWQ